MRCAKKCLFLFLLTASSGKPTPELCFLTGWLNTLPKQRYGDAGLGSNTQTSDWEAD